MFTVRKAIPTDLPKLLLLYKAVAAIPGGIARDPAEINYEYIYSFMEDASRSGLELVIENPADPNELIAEIHCYRWGPAKFSHVFGELTIVVAPSFQQHGLGKLLFGELLTTVENACPDILRVELFAQQSNTRAIRFYEKLGFQQEGQFKDRVRSVDGGFENDIPMAWFNKNFKK